MRKSKRLIEIITFTVFLLALLVLEISDYGERGITNYCSDFKIFDMQWNYTVTSVYDSLKMLPSEGIKHYEYYLIADTIMTLSLAGVQYYLAKWVTKKRNLKGILIILAELRAATDFIENTSLMLILSSFPIHCNKTIVFCSIITKIKLSALLVFWILFIILFVIKLIKKINIKKEDV